MLQKYDPKPNTWVGDWLKGIIGGRLLKKDEDTVDGIEENEEGAENAESEDSSSDDNSGGLKIPLPDLPTRNFK